MSPFYKLMFIPCQFIALLCSVITAVVIEEEFFDSRRDQIMYSSVSLGFIFK